MTVYELIKMLTDFEPDQQVRFHFSTEFNEGRFDECVDFCDIRNDAGYPSNAEIILNF